MYYEEKTINGVLSYRTAPAGEWKPFTSKELTTRLEYAEHTIQACRAALSNYR